MVQCFCYCMSFLFERGFRPLLPCLITLFNSKLFQFISGKENKSSRQ